MKITIGICDTKEACREQITDLILEYASSRQCELECRDYKSAEEYLQSQETVDILLLDTELKEMSGIQLKDWLLENGRQEVLLFISSHSGQMREAFGRNVYGFLEKPPQKKSFFECLDKIVSDREEFGQVYIGKGRYILCDRIMYIKAIDKYVEIHTTDSVEIGYFSLKEIQSFLPRNGFKRVHRSYVVHFDYIAKIGTEIVMRDGSVVHPMRGTVKGLKKEYIEYVRSR